MDQPKLSEFQLALLYGAANDTNSASYMEAALQAEYRRLFDLGLVTPDSSAVGYGYVITDVGKAYLAANAGNRGVV